MQELIRRAIEAEAKKRLARYSKNQYYTHKYRKSFSKRTDLPAAVPPHSLPPQWAFHKHYDPRYCLNHSRFISLGIWSSLVGGLYEPKAALRSRVAKPSGGFREIDAFSIPDAAVAKIFLVNLRKRNAKVFSSSSYAYQQDKAPLDAVLRLTELLKVETAFISQYDFSKYFDSIRHDYLDDLLSASGSFLTTIMERSVIASTMRHEYLEPGTAPAARAQGVPQGNSISLFLANVAAHPLDMDLEKLNGSFVRFADDAVVVNTSYEDALASARAYDRFAAASGVAINREKSSGIRLFSEHPAEMAHTARFEFLGYRFTRRGLFVGERAYQAIKRRCAKIIYNHLLLHPRRTGTIAASRLGVGFRDWDLVTCINELRGYIYGGRSQATIETFLAGGADIKNMTGAASYFCLVEDAAVFRELDGWLHHCLVRAHAQRMKMVKALTGKTHKAVGDSALKKATWYKFPKVAMDTTVPSFYLAWRAGRKSWSRHGLGGVDVVGMGYSYDE